MDASHRTWLRIESSTIFDAVICESSMVFMRLDGCVVSNHLGVAKAFEAEAELRRKIIKIVVERVWKIADALVKFVLVPRTCGHIS